MTKPPIGLMSDQLDEEQSEPKTQYGVVTGRVVNLLDPLAQARVQVQFPWLDGTDLSAWARVAVPTAGPFHGMYFMPNIGDEVLVAFEHGDINHPYIIGALWSLKAPPPLPSPLLQIRTERTLSGNQIVFTDGPPSLTIQSGPTPPLALPAPPSPTGPHQTMAMSPVGIQIIGNSIMLQAADSIVTISPAGITLQSGANSVVISKAGIVILGHPQVQINPLG